MPEYEDLRARTKRFALSIVRFYAILPHTTEAQVIGRQLLRSGTSVGAHYHEGCRARSKAEFISKLEGAQQELEESMYWLELVAEAGIAKPVAVTPLLVEAKELMAILSASVTTSKQTGRSPAKY